MLIVRDLLDLRGVDESIASGRGFPGYIIRVEFSDEGDLDDCPSKSFINDGCSFADGRCFTQLCGVCTQSVIGTAGDVERSVVQWNDWIFFASLRVCRHPLIWAP